MVFGEIIEPSSRALWEDDFVDYPDDDGSQLKCQTDLAVPEIINTLLIGDSGHILTFLKKCVLYHTRLLNDEPAIGLSFYKIEEDSYVILYKANPDIIVGKITEILIPWLSAAKNIHVLSSAPLISLQNYTYTGAPNCVIRSLSTKISSAYPKLEVPNLVTGLGASILSFCIHKGLGCTMYVGFLDGTFLDSLNTAPLVDLLKHLKVKPLNRYTLENQTQSNNLYM